MRLLIESLHVVCKARERHCQTGLLDGLFIFITETIPTFPLLLHANQNSVFYYISPHFSDNAEPYKGVKQTIYQQDAHSRYYKSCSFNCNFSIYV